MKVTIDLSAPLYTFYKKGIIQALYKKGNPNPIYYRYYECFLAYIDQGNNRTTSIKLASDECGINERTIQRAVKAIEEK